MQTSTPRRMVIYARISDDREGREWGVIRQERQCRTLAKRNGDHVVEVYVDNDTGAFSGRKRPDYARMIAVLEAGGADGVIALAPTRLYRHLYEPKTRQDALSFIELVGRRGLAVETVKAGRFDLSTADGRKEAKRAALDAEYESDLLSERTKEGKADTVSRGGFRGGPRPFGYRSGGMELEPAEAELIEPAMDALLTGESLGSIARSWNAQGFTTPARRRRDKDGARTGPVGIEWNPVAVQRTLLRARNAGLMEVKGEVVGPAAWPAIVSEAKWRTVRELLTDPARRTTTAPNARKWLGSRLYQCSCGELMISATTTVGGRKGAWVTEPAYKCATSGHRLRRAAPLDAYISAVVVERLSRPDAVDLLRPAPNDGSEDLAATANALRAKLDELTDLYTRDEITGRQYADGTARVRGRLAHVEAQMTVVMESNALASLPLGSEEIATRWEELSVARKRAIIDVLMTVVIGKGPAGRPKGYAPGQASGYFSPAGIEIRWKSGPE